MKRNPLTYRLNAYFSVLIVTVVGAAATLVIVHIGTTTAARAAQQAQVQTALYKSLGQ